MPSDLRAYVKGEVMPLLPDTWEWSDTMRSRDSVNVTTVVFKLLGLEPLEVAPLGHVQARCVLTIITPLSDPEQAELQVDDDVLALIVALDPHSTIAWADARKVKDDQTDRLAWDITLTTIITKES